MATTHDLLIVTDATMSMGSYLDALKKSIPEILTLTKLSGVFSRIAVLAYKDYTYRHEEVVLWSGWNNPDLDNFVKKITKGHGGDFPEAAKTAMIHILDQVDEHASTLVLWYTDAPPHHGSTASHHEHPNDVRERHAFPTPGALDWVKLCQSAQRKNCTVFCFTPDSITNSDTSFYVLLSTLTGGLCINTKNTHNNYSTVISRLTLGVMLQWMGQPSDMKEVLAQSSAAYRKYKEPPITSELIDEGRGSMGFLPPSFDDRAAKTGHKLRPFPLSPLTSAVIPRGSLSETAFTFGKRFADPADEAYKNLVYTSLAEIIQHNIFSLTYNPIFGKLWRAVCRNEDERKILLLDAFSIGVSKVTGVKEKETLNQWLEDSFDATEEIEEIISRVEPGGALVYLDLDADVNLTRTELLEVSKSCYAPVLKNVATLFTHLKLVEPGVTLTATQRAIPLSLSPAQFFRIIPHLVVPGTIYPLRAAAMTAIISLITAVPFLRERATEFLAPLKGTWLNLEVPENVSYDCARFLLSAPQGMVLDEREKEVYKAMRRYRLIELNSESVISAQVPWKPHKTTEVGDRKVKCQKCNIARSVTLMSGEQPGVCGLCIANEFAQSVPTDYPEKEAMASSWVECSASQCHAQYVVENPRLLNIRPRCHYCRNSLPCPYLECTRCTNRIIVPKPYRAACIPADGQYMCPACENPQRSSSTTITQETTCKALNEQNGIRWLGLDPAVDLFTGKSAFKIIQAHDFSVFDMHPSKKAMRKLMLDGKKVRDPENVLLQVERRVEGGHVDLGSCSLCFEEMPRGKLVPACGRSGCKQKVDERCLLEWYGKSEPGRLLNLMQLACPFCRRKPAVKILARHNPRAATLGGLEPALADHGWFYAWCISCGFAKRAHERVCCEGDRVPPVDQFRCSDCMGVSTVDGIGRLTECPQCGVLVEKSHGCNHIECHCGQHFCHVCGKGTAESEIYDHMAREHGGIFDGGAGMDDEDDYDDYDSDY